MCSSSDTHQLCDPPRKLLNFSVPQFPLLQIESHLMSLLSEPVRDLNEVICCRVFSRIRPVIGTDMQSLCVLPPEGFTSRVTQLPVAVQVQFGHAGACAHQASETAVAKNQALKEAGVFVPPSFDELGEIIQ